MAEITLCGVFRSLAGRGQISWRLNGPVEFNRLICEFDREAAGIRDAVFSSGGEVSIRPEVTVLVNGSALNSADTQHLIGTEDSIVIMLRLSGG